MHSLICPLKKKRKMNQIYQQIHQMMVQNNKILLNLKLLVKRKKKTNQIHQKVEMKILLLNKMMM